jgi:hypothetical protein
MVDELRGGHEQFGQTVGQYRLARVAADSVC